MGVLWYFQFVLKTAYNTDILPKYDTLKKKKLNSIIKALIKCTVCPFNIYIYFFKEKVEEKKIIIYY